MKKSRVPSTKSAARRRGQHLFAALLAGAMVGLTGAASAVPIAQTPLYAGSRVPGNVVLVPSVEYPTVISQANIGDYSDARRYAGYFDPGKCYEYVYHQTESERHFKPVRVSTDCSQSKEWSGNYLNWAATQTIDPFRSALTGGYRVKDTPTETWLEKARHPRGDLFPNRTISNSVSSKTPADWSSFKTRIQNLGNKMRFSNTGNLDGNATAYNPSSHTLNKKARDTVYEVSIRVKVCDSSVGLEENCKQYSQGWKPEGLIQEYSDRIRYSIFGYVNEDGNGRDGGVMRARQKFVGPKTYYPEMGEVVNVAREWSPETGQAVGNPDPDDAAATGYGVVNSGVINYLNRFGQMNAESLKSNDPVSELYYAALRYIRGQGNVAAYTNNLSSLRVDGFPVIRDWDDPIRYACQVNAALGIGDVYTHYDHNIPDADDLKIARDYTSKIFSLESINKAASAEFSGRGNSAYIAGLAYYANTNDLRPDGDAPNSKGMQTLSTYWVDVRENQKLEPKAANQYWLAAKYGGMRVPTDFKPLEATTASIQQAWWHTTGDYLRSGDSGEVVTTVTNYPRPDNFYVASEADKMVQSLRQAFQNIVDEMVGSGGGFASNTTVLETGAMTFQARFRVDGEAWSGDLQAFNVDAETGALTATWTAASNLPAWASRNIWINSGTFKRFDSFASLSGAHQAELESQAVVDYLRGNRTGEQPSGSLRRRTAVLGDIVNSEPVYVGAPNPRLYIGSSFQGAASYQSFAADSSGRREMVYVGANDGMLHGFDATTGAEVFAFVPSGAVSAGLGDYAKPGFQHRYFVDGELTVADVYDAGSSKWKTVLVGTLGRGGRGIFALDVTDPESPKFLWEFSGADISALGNNLGKPIIAQVADGDWRVFLGNGPNSASGVASLVTVGVFSGARTAIGTGAGDDNGLSGVNVWSSTPGGFSDTVYAGDLKGNLWKYQSSTNSFTKLFESGPTQPISGTPLVSRRPGTAETWVFFGTGRYLNEADLSNKSRQTWYGLIDRNDVVAKSTLREMSIIVEGEIDGVAVRGIEQDAAVSSGNGWYMDLVSPVNGEEGERMVIGNKFRGRALIGTTRIPDAVDPCSPSGRGFIMAVDPFSGGRLPGGSFFDVDGDGSFDETIGEPPIPVSGIGTPSGPNNPIFIGNIMQVSLDDTTSKSVETSGQGLEPERVSWRELIGN